MTDPKDNHLMETIKSVFVPIHPEGHRFIAIFLAVTVLLALLSDVLGAIGAVLTLWCVYFFRNPARFAPADARAIIAPADGKVQSVITQVPPAELDLGDAPHTRISIFMNVFNVHVNRSPVAGEIALMHYIPGKFLNASMDKASEENERQLMTVQTADHTKIGVVQIAGLVARRIVTFVKPNQTLTTGEVFGLIRFGSRVDVYLPEGIEPLVVEGQTMVAGETVLARLKG
jgi:phosphatidylserine decarboxylase